MKKVFQDGCHDGHIGFKTPWKTYFILLLKFYWRDFNENWWNCSVPIQTLVLLFCKLVLNPIWRPWQPSWKTYLILYLIFHWRDFNETWFECSVQIPDQMGLFFKLILNPILTPWQPSWKIISYFNSSFTGRISLKLDANIQYQSLIKFYFASWF